MYQIDVPSAARLRPAVSVAGTPGYFTDGDLVAGVEPTVVPAEFLNMLMLELLNVLGGAGIAPAKGASDQLLGAIESLIESRSGNYAVDTGVADGYVVALDPPVQTYASRNGMPVKFRAIHGNTGPCTLDAGAGPRPLLRDDGTALQKGDIADNSIVAATYDEPANAFLVNTIVLSQFGVIAKLGLGQFLKADASGNLVLKLGAFLGDDGNGSLTVPIGMGLEPDGSGRLRVKIVDASLRRTDAGVQQSGPVAAAAGARAIAAADNGTNIVSTADSTLTLPKSSSLWNGFAFSVDARVGVVTVTPNPADGIDGGTAGVSYIVPNGTSAKFIADGAAGYAVMHQTVMPGASPAPQYIAASQSVSSGQYNVDTTANPVQLTLPANPALGTSLRLIDPFYSWSLRNVVLVPGGTNTINGSSGSFPLDVSGADVLFIFKSGNWSIQ